MRGSGRFLFANVLLSSVIAGVAFFGTADLAQALPSFARQTGQPCGACHTDFPGLTPFGRQFKLGGYTLGGGQFRTTPFPAAEDGSTKALVDYAKKALPSDKASSAATDTSNVWVPPISVMTIVGFTHTHAPQNPAGSPYSPNDNVVASPISVFWGGAITDHVGAFVQGTYNAPGMGMPPDFFTHKWTWDNADIRYANTAKLGSVDVSYGITVNNNPSVQDLWNTTPAWGFPYALSNLAPTPATKTLIDGTLAAHVGGVGGYAYINNLLYLELSGYQTLNFSAQNRLGTDPFGAPGLFSRGVAPYWRAALEPNWGNHWFEIGTFGMLSQVQPWIDPTGATSTSTFTQSDKFRDVGFDSQYQYKGDNFWVTLRSTYIHERQRPDASFANGLTANSTNKLNTLRIYGSLAYGNDNRIVLTGQYFDTWGSVDPVLYAGLASGLSPNSRGYIAEIAYIPFINSSAPLWPWANARLGAQYTYYTKFDGTAAGAHANNTWFLYAWFAM